jgi:hypothetical protein
MIPEIVSYPEPGWLTSSMLSSWDGFCGLFQENAWKTPIIGNMWYNSSAQMTRSALVVIGIAWEDG